MEKVMSVEDKIRKAEEIYYRRKNQEIPVRENVIKPIKEKKNIKLMKKMIKQIIICLVIYSVSYLIVNNNYIFSSDFTQKAREILSQDIDFSQIYSYILTTIKQENQSTEVVEETIEQEKTKQEIQNNDENIGGAEELPIAEEQNVENVVTTQ